MHDRHAKEAGLRHVCELPSGHLCGNIPAGAAETSALSETQRALGYPPLHYIFTLLQPIDRLQPVHKLLVGSYWWHHYMLSTSQSESTQA